MEIKAVFIKETKEIIYSRARHDYRTSSNGKVSIDGGLDYTRIIGNPSDYIILELDGDKLLSQILEYDWGYKNSNADKFPEGFCGRFQITPRSNREFYKELILNYNEIAEYFRNS